MAHVQAKKAEIEQKTMQGEVVLRDDAVQEFSEAVANMRAKLLNLPHKMSPAVVGSDD